MKSTMNESSTDKLVIPLKVLRSFFKDVPGGYQCLLPNCTKVLIGKYSSTTANGHATSAKHREEVRKILSGDVWTEQL